MAACESEESKMEGSCVSYFLLASLETVGHKFSNNSYSRRPPCWRAPWRFTFSTIYPAFLCYVESLFHLAVYLDFYFLFSFFIF